MKLPSLYAVFDGTVTAITRFPFSMLSAFLLTVGWASYCEMPTSASEIYHLVPLCLTLFLAMPLYATVTLAGEEFEWNTQRKWIGYGVITAILIGLFCSFLGTATEYIPRYFYSRYVMFLLVAWLSLFIVPCIKEYTQCDAPNFYLYSFVLIKKLAMVTFSAGIISIGILSILEAIRGLWGIRMDESWLIHSLIITWGLIAPLMFAAQIPRKIAQIRSVVDFPYSLAKFILYVILPILTIYSIILYWYGGQTLIMWNWPSGLIVPMVTTIVFFGILIICALTPFAEKSILLRRTPRIISILLLPLLVLFFLGIWLRVDAYAMTINRYFVLGFGVWSTFVAGYFAIGKRNLLVPPISLALFILFISFGSWGCFAVSERSQVKHALSILEEHGVLKDGRIINETPWGKIILHYSEDQVLANSKLLSPEKISELNSTFQYIAKEFRIEHQFDSIFTPQFNQRMAEKRAHEKIAYYKTSSMYLAACGIARYESTKAWERVELEASSVGYNVSGYDYCFEFDAANTTMDPDFLYSYKNNKWVKLQLNVENFSFYTTTSLESWSFSFKEEIEKAAATASDFTNRKPIVLTSKGELNDVTLVITYFVVVKDEKGYELLGAKGRVFFKEHDK